MACNLLYLNTVIQFRYVLEIIGQTESLSTTNIEFLKFLHFVVMTDFIR